MNRIAAIRIAAASFAIAAAIAVPAVPAGAQNVYFSPRRPRPPP